MPAARFPVTPFTAPVSGDLEQRLSAMADALASRAYVDSELRALKDRLTALETNENPVFTSIVLTDSSGGHWQVTVDTTGALHTVLVP